MVESHLQYGIVVWVRALNTHLSSLEVRQKRFLKSILAKDTRYSKSQMFIAANVSDILSVTVLI